MIVCPITSTVERQAGSSGCAGLRFAAALAVFMCTYSDATVHCVLSCPRCARYLPAHQSPAGPNERGSSSILKHGNPTARKASRITGPTVAQPRNSHSSASRNARPDTSCTVVPLEAPKIISPPLTHRKSSGPSIKLRKQSMTDNVMSLTR